MYKYRSGTVVVEFDRNNHREVVLVPEREAVDLAARLKNNSYAAWMRVEELRT